MKLIKRKIFKQSSRISPKGQNISTTAMMPLDPKVQNKKQNKLLL